MDEIKVSIIVPFHNVQDYIGSCIETAANQTLKDIEIIFINDNSDDSSADILDKYAKNDKRIKQIKLSSRQGQGYARNIGIEHARGKYIGFIDADDWVDETMFEKLYNRSEEFNSDISMCKTILFDETEQKELFYGYYQLDGLKPFFNKSFNAYDTISDILNFNVAIWNKIYRTDFLKSFNIKFPSGYIFEDLPFFFETYLKANSISIVDENLYHYRINRPNSTMQNIGGKICNRVDMLELSFEHIRKYYAFNEIESLIINWLVEDILHRAGVIEPQYFEEYFNKSKEFLKKIGFTSKEALKDKKITYLDEVLSWVNSTPSDAMLYIRIFKSIDKKLDKPYSIGAHHYDRLKFLVKLINEKNATIYDDLGKLSGKYNTQLTLLYDDFTNQTAQYDEYSKAVLNNQKQLIENEQEDSSLNIKNNLKCAREEIELDIANNINPAVQTLCSHIKEQSAALKEQYDKKLNKFRVNCEQKLIHLEESNSNISEKLSPFIGLAETFYMKKEKQNGK